MRIFRYFLFCFSGILSISASSQDYSIAVCNSCGSIEAQEIAITNASPLISCQAFGDEQLSIHNQQCFSVPNNYYILSLDANQIYGYYLSHTNQGGQPWEMALETQELTLNLTTENIISTAVEYALVVNSNLSAAVQLLERTYTSPDQLTHANESNYQEQPYYSNTISTNNENCLQHPSYRAMSHGMSPATRVDLEIQLNEKYNSTTNSLYSEFQGYRVTGGSVGFSKNGISFGISGEFVDEYKYFTQYYSWLSPSLVGEDYDAPRIVFQASYYDGQIHVTVNESMSIVDGVSIKELRSENSTLSGSNQITLPIALRLVNIDKFS